MSDKNKQPPVQLEEIDLQKEIGFIPSLIVQAFDQEYTRSVLRDRYEGVVERSNSGTVHAWFYDRYLKTNFVTFFTDQAVEKLSVDVLSSELIRDFVMNVTERFLTTATYVALDKASVVSTDFGMDATVITIMANKPEDANNYSLLNKEFAMSIAISKEKATNLAKDNKWLMVLYYLFQHYHYTDAAGKAITQ